MKFSPFIFRQLRICSILLSIIISSTNLIAQSSLLENSATLDVGKARYKISRNIYGHFSEHLGHCIYGGFWVGEDSQIPNVRGIRTDVVDAMNKIKAPVLRWPGGCFADEYHWKDGIGPRSLRPTMINTNWGGVTEDNSFGTHEFLDLCEQIGCEPYFSGNIGSGTIQELSQWVEYVNSDNVSPMTELRKKNGRDKSWGVAYWGLGNETWGCGGNMKPEYYSQLANHFSTFMKNFGSNELYKIAVGPSGGDYNWTEVVMREMGNSIWGLSLHNYTWTNERHATDTDQKSWYSILSGTLHMDEFIAKHSAIMNKYDPGKSVSLVVDEWGTWYQVEPGTNPGFLFQQNTLCDALVAGINLNIFNNHCDRVKMAAIAQAINVLQSVILTRDDKIVLTPTYHVFDMYKVHHDAVLIPTSLQTDSIEINGGKIPSLNISSSFDKNGKMHITVCNLSATEDKNLNCAINAFTVGSAVGQIITADELNAHNTFESPNNVVIKPFGDFKTSGHSIEIVVPKHSVVALEVIGELEIKAPEVNEKNLKPGVQYHYYEGQFQRLPDFSNIEPIRTGVIKNILYPEGIAANNFGLNYSGYIKIDNDGMYEFFLTSDDGSKLAINGETVVLNDGLHAMIEKSGSVYLKKGYHAVELSFFQLGGGSGLRLMMNPPDGLKEEVNDESLFHLEN
ncbi:MAG: alpha-L-arabinofuranosidase C-terminal domain-containing protein [bacterium]